MKEFLDFSYAESDWKWWRLQPHLPAVSTVLRTHLQSQDIYVRRVVVGALAAMRDNTTEVVPELMFALNNERAVVRVAAAEALAGFGPQARPAVPALKVALQDDYLTVRLAARAAVREIKLPAGAGN